MDWWKILRDFFNQQSCESKKNLSIISGGDVGYMKTENVKEFWQVDFFN